MVSIVCRSVSACILKMNLHEFLQKVHVAAARKRSHQWCVSLTPNNTKTIGRMTCNCFLRSIRRDLTSSPILYTLLLVKKKKNDGQYDKARKIDVFGRELGRGDLSLTFLAILLKKYSICREYRLKVTVSRGLVHLLKRFYRSTALHKHCNIERLPFLGNFPWKFCHK